MKTRERIDPSQLDIKDSRQQIERECFRPLLFFLLSKQRIRLEILRERAVGNANSNASKDPH